ncbi:MAG: hypothetical protein K6F53_06460 [Lachnospiraceae bacterium]|nr:hypothetical protein [Lachnospiraceae bacterium]
MEGQLILRADTAAESLASAAEEITRLRDLTELLSEGCRELAGGFEGEAAKAFISETGRRIDVMKERIRELSELSALLSEAALKIALAKKKAAFLADHIGKTPG